MKRIAILMIAVLGTATMISCESKSGLRAKHIEQVKEKVIMRIPIKDVSTYAKVSSGVSAMSYWKDRNTADFSLVNMKGIFTQVQDTVYVHEITYIKEVR